jgi:hypothetical protein
LTDHLALSERLVGVALVSPAAWERLYGIPDVLPPAAKDAALELRLERDDPRVDFTVCLDTEPSQRRWLVTALARSGVAAGSRRWERVLTFLRAWANVASSLHVAVHAVWLEFDADGDGAPEPFLIFSLDEERLYAGGTATPDALLAPVRAGLERLGGSDPRAMEAVTRCLRGLPRYAQLRHVALRPTAVGDVVRLVLRMPWRRVPGALAALGWPGDAFALHALLERLCPDTPVHPINIDVTPDGLGPRVGIEFIHTGAPHASSRWRALFDALESLGACDPGRRAALATWGGGIVGPRVGPGRLIVKRDLMVKVVHGEGAPLRAKAYLAFAPRLLTLGRPSRARTSQPNAPAP